MTTQAPVPTPPEDRPESRSGTFRVGRTSDKQHQRPLVGALIVLCLVVFAGSQVLVLHAIDTRLNVLERAVLTSVEQCATKAELPYFARPKSPASAAPARGAAAPAQTGPAAPAQ